MDIKLNNLIFSGVHGWTEKERKARQRFRIDIEIKVINEFLTKDDLIATVDYRKIKKVIQEIIENKSFFLVETIVDNIADGILDIDKVYFVHVILSKIDIWDNGYPSVSVRRIKSFSGLIDFDFDSIIMKIMEDGGVSFPILDEKRRLLLLGEAESYNYIRQPEVVEESKVIEQLSSFSDFKPGSLFHDFSNDFVETLNLKLSSSIFSRSIKVLQFNEKSLQKYDPDSIGITTHKDNFSCKDLIAVLVLKGESKFALCSDRQGSNPIYLDTTPGNIILMRGPGFLGSNKRPFHFVSDIPEERIVLGLRNKV